MWGGKLSNSFPTFSHHDFKVWEVNKSLFQAFKEADSHSALTLSATRDKFILKCSQYLDPGSSSASPLSPVNSNGDKKRSKYSCLERWQALPWTSHKIKHKLFQHRARAELRTCTAFLPTGAQDHKTASCCPTSWASCHPVQGICLFPDHGLQNTAIHPDMSIRNAPSRISYWLRVIGSSALLYPPWLWERKPSVPSCSWLLMTKSLAQGQNWAFVPWEHKEGENCSSLPLTPHNDL